MTTPVLDREAVLEAARAAGRRAAHTRHAGGLIDPAPDPHTGPLLVRQAATAWHRGFAETREDLAKFYVPDLVKVGPEGYIHGYICVRPPCGEKPGHVKAADLAVQRDGGIVHRQSGWAIGHVARDGGKFVAHHADGHQTSHDSRTAALKAVARRHNSGKPKPGQDAGHALRGDEAFSHVQSASELGAKENAGVRDYTTASFLYNSPLRTGGKLGAQEAEHYRNIQSAFAKASPTTHEIVAYRGVTASLFGKGNAKGTQFVDKGFTSMSTNRDTASQFGSEDSPAVMEIHVPAGSKVVKPGGSSYYTGENDEKELILNNGGRFEITSDEMVDDPQLGKVRKLTAMYTG